ncbi:formimidoylglutamase [Winogradskyella alexanderae]|uniref:Formimidoylglutamase n=1 Tax=Winogradskyella alexanderae TaxID=2877123 RepID=A0ABS7XT98_9FLAO|nr:formimidoylglutamase [Winogradskyella alexanderae]MCA0132653.1 formimidoylglutamase [Winogradskyella alexanderae]
MKNLVLFTNKDRDSLVNSRRGETKFGEQVSLLPNLTTIYEDICSLDVEFVIFGIAEDFGVRANHGQKGTKKAWQSGLKYFLNTQYNTFNNANKIAILGHLEYIELEKEVKDLDLTKKKSILKLRKLVEEIDKDVSYLVSCIIKAGKIPIIIGGGHNNAYGIIKGCALALNNKINAINFDAHSDFRPEEGRHSGNGFSYAYAEGFLKRYFIFGLHENYTSQTLLKTIKKLKDIQFNTFEALEIRKELNFEDACGSAQEFVSKDSFGIEIDCDAIENMPSSAMTPSGFTLNQARRFVHFFGSNKKAIYLHICEASPSKKTYTQVGKAISYLITDFVRARS